MYGYEWLEINKRCGNIFILLWQCREEIVLQRPRHDDRNSDLLLLDGCEVVRANLTADPPSRIIAICWLTVSIEDYASGFEPH